MCTALPPRSSPLTTKTAATVHSRLWPTVLAWPEVADRRRFLRLSLLRPWRCMTLPPGVLRSRVLVRGVVALPRPRFVLRDPGRSALPLLPSFLLCPILCPILRFASRFASVDFRCAAIRLAHAELSCELPDPRRARQLRNLDLKPLPFF